MKEPSFAGEAGLGSSTFGQTLIEPHHSKLAGFAMITSERAEQKNSKDHSSER